MVASYKQCEELDYESIYYVNPVFAPYLPKDSRIVLAVSSERPKADLAIFLFPSQKNLPLIWKLKRQGAKGGVYLPRASGSDEGVSRSRLL